MYFLLKTDLYDKITALDLDTVTGTIDSLIDNAELKAMAEIDSYLSKIYDMKKAWAATGRNRNQLLMQYSTIILLYHLHARISPNAVPSSRLYEYDTVLKTLKEMAAGKLSIALPLLPISTDPDVEQLATTFQVTSKSFVDFNY